ncbi:MAG: hypothetical protein A2Y95_08560 [Deltaproteobacteria bacterium RBG_13_65_10]|nr:MAG: hypothetical protein A2Y95_08560 [Deltaproteobacteria bacterium RBG_13_65_10]
MKMRYDTEDLALAEIAQWIGGRRGQDAAHSCTLSKLRNQILRKVPGTREKANGHEKMPYLGYRHDLVDVAYIYIQAGGLVVDVRRSRRSIAPAIQQRGVHIRTKDNYQERAGGWTTGIRLPHNATGEQIGAVAGLIAAALTS